MVAIKKHTKMKIETITCREWDTEYLDLKTGLYSKILNGLRMRSEKISAPNHPTLTIAMLCQGTPPFLKGGETCYI